MEHLFSRTFVTSSLRSLDPGGIKKTSWQTEVSMLLVSVLRFLLVERWCHDSALHSTLRFSFYSPKHKVWVHEKNEYSEHEGIADTLYPKGRRP